MKLIPYRRFGEDGNGLKTRDVILMVASQGQHVRGGLGADEVLRRTRILKALDACGEGSPGMRLEDADYEHLKKLVAEFPFLQATIELGQVITDINEATEPEGA